MYESENDVYVMPKTNFLDTVTIKDSTAGKISGVVIFGLPILIIVSGVLIGLRRRRL